MRISQQLRQCIWLVSTLYDAEGLTFDELNMKWKESGIEGGLPLSRTTFFRLRDSIQDMFGIIIECKAKGGYHYYIYNKEAMSCQSESSHFCSLCPCAREDFILQKCNFRHKIMIKIREDLIR